MSDALNPDADETFEVPLSAMPRGVQLAILVASPKPEPKRPWWRRRRRH